MRRRISWLVAATTSAVVLAFVIPLCLLVRTVAAERAMSSGNDEARSVAILVSSLQGNPELPQLVAQADRRGQPSTSVVMPDGTVLGSPDGDATTDPNVAAAARGQAFTERSGASAEIFIPVVTEQGTMVVETYVSPRLMRAGVYEAWLSLAGLGVLLLAAALFVAARLGRRVSEPVTDLAEVAQRLHEGDLEARAVPRGPEETVELAETLNRLADRIVELLVAERAAVGNLSHRLRTPVTALRLDAETLADGSADDDLADRLQQHVEQLQRTVDAVVQDARRPLRSNLGASCDATTVVRERAAFWSALAEDQDRPVRVTLPRQPALVSLDRTDLTDIVDVLVDNVFAHTPGGTPFAITLIGRPHGGAVLEVADEGPGLDHRRDPRPGTSGIGLQIVRRTAAGAGGHLDLTSGADGVVARLTLPGPGPQGAGAPAPAGG